MFQLILIMKFSGHSSERSFLKYLKLDAEVVAKQFNALIESYIYNGQEPIRDDVFKCLGNRPSILQARSIGERIIIKMRAFVETFIEGMVG